ncbi:MAG: alpha/beta fold hydrolase [Gemmatimonadota bacterium]
MKLLHHARIVSPAGSPLRWAYFLHGLLGAGRNWRSIARRLVENRPEWGALLVDLRMHGSSVGFPGPHTLAACARDVRRLAAHLGTGPAALLGHSFGGKVALRYVDDGVVDLEQAWIIDSTPSVCPPRGGAVEMLKAVRALPSRFPSRLEAVSLLQAFGFPSSMANWMSTNLVRIEGEMTWRFDVAAMEQLLADFLRADLWKVVESAVDRPEFHFVRATASDVLSEDDVQRILRLEDRGRSVRVYSVNGGHWLNADNPSAVVGLLVRHLP